MSNMVKIYLVSHKASSSFVLTEGVNIQINTCFSV